MYKAYDPYARHYQIYQLKNDPDNHYYAFERYDILQKFGMKVERDRYNKVYEGEIKPGDDLESLYYRFNMDRPTDFKGHSMSISDIVVWENWDENGESMLQAFYCDSIGFRSVPEFLLPEEQLLVNISLDSQSRRYEVLKGDDGLYSVIPFNSDFEMGQAYSIKAGSMKEACDEAIRLDGYEGETYSVIPNGDYLMKESERRYEEWKSYQEEFSEDEEADRYEPEYHQRRGGR